MTQKIRQTMRRCRRLVRAMAGRELLERADLHVPLQQHGTDYGGWTFCPKGLGCDSVLYSFGVGTDISFDLGVIGTFGCELHAFDPTPKAVAWIHRQPLPPQFMFHEFGLAAYDGFAQFQPPSNQEHVSFSMVSSSNSLGSGCTLPVRRLTTVMEMLGHPCVDLLKIDIEGAEYDVLCDFVRARPNVRQILVEFHHRFSPSHVARTRQAICSLREAGYGIAYVTPTGEEYTFLKRT